MTKVFVIFGATGQQGGALLNYILAHPVFSKTYHLRAITRNASKPTAERLKERGVEVVEADINKPDTLTIALAGAYGVFAVTNFYETGCAAGEFAQGKAIADAALAAGVSLFIFSSLPYISKITNGEITTIQHFDGKAQVEEYIRTLPFASSVFILTGWFMQNVWSPVTAQPKLLDDGTVLFNFAWTPSTPVPYIDISDIGKYLAPALQDPAKYDGARFTASTAIYTAQEIVDAWSEVSGKKVVLPTAAQIPILTDDPIQQQYARIGNLFRKWGYFGPTGQKDMEWTLAQMVEKPNTWKQFLQDNGPWFETVNEDVPKAYAGEFPTVPQFNSTF